MGCYADNKQAPVFTISPGDYKPVDLNPVSCMNTCGKRWHFAGIRNGNTCMCSKIKPPDENMVDGILCNTNCTGVIDNGKSSWFCGGKEHFSVYNISKRITGFDIKKVIVFFMLNDIEVKLSQIVILRKHFFY